ncbi:MAG: hypothetical protein COC12_08320 [Rhodobacteraceae bacterium]|nr:MAG: hypothetical protein COC12_08320 [Paracoccaceae bacterium]
MGLSDEQLKFIEDFILRRQIAGAGNDQAAQQDRQDRTNQRLEILKSLAAVDPLNEGLADEQKTRSDLAEKVRAALADDTPTHDDLKAAGDALRELTDHVTDVQDDIARVRKPRFEKGKRTLSALAAIAMDLPEQCPQDDRLALTKERADLSAMLAPMRDWAQITKWDAEDLIDIDARLDTLAREVKTLRQDVEQAVLSLTTARTAATKVIAPSKAFSKAQSDQMAKMFGEASERAAKNVLKAGEPLKELENLVKYAATTARIRARAGNRIAALTRTAPAGASVAQKTEWTRLRDDALAAADEVLDA